MIEYINTSDVPIGDLTRFPGNAKHGDVERIRESIKEHGQFRSLVVRDTGDGRMIVLAGNHTMDAMAAEEYEAVRCEIIMCDDQTATKINLVDNKAADAGDYDMAAVAALLGSLDDTVGTGFTDVEVGDLLDDLDPPVVIPDGPTDARYSETDDDLAAREQRAAQAGERESAPYDPDTGTTEMIVVMTGAQRQRAVAIIKAQQERDPAATAGKVVLDALRCAPAVGRIAALCFERQADGADGPADADTLWPSEILAMIKEADDEHDH
jgi:ParB-like chromosome segregation protein Spo0J